MKTFLTFERDIDFALLRDQKHTLIGFIGELREEIGQEGEQWHSEADVELLDGIVALLNGLQIKAATKFGEEAVYGVKDSSADSGS